MRWSELCVHSPCVLFKFLYSVSPIISNYQFLGFVKEQSFPMKWAISKGSFVYYTQKIYCCFLLLLRITTGFHSILSFLSQCRAQKMFVAGSSPKYRCFRAISLVLLAPFCVHFAKNTTSLCSQF